MSGTGWVAGRYGDRMVETRVRHGDGPAALLMSGAAQPAEYWRPVVARLPGLTVVSYDRPGMGATPWPGRLPALAEEVATAAAIAAELAAERGPVVLAAHSMAAFHAEALVRELPDAVAGLVLVDPSVEWPTRPPTRPGPALARAVGRLAGHGLSGVGRAGAAAATLAQSGWTLRRVRARFNLERLRQVFGRPDSLAMATAELMAYDGQAWDLMGVRGRFPWPGTPTILLSAERSGAEQENGRQARLAQLLGAELRMVRGSRHLMMLDEPGAIAGAIRDLA